MWASLRGLLLPGGVGRSMSGLNHTPSDQDQLTVLKVLPDDGRTFRPAHYLEPPFVSGDAEACTVDGDRCAPVDKEW